MPPPADSHVTLELPESLRDHVTVARERLMHVGIRPETAARDAERLARHVLQWNRAQYLTHAPEPPPAGFPDQFHRLLERRERREPMDFIIGTCEFWGLTFAISRDVLVPRPETELIVEEALAVSRAGRPSTIVDAGTGSGCLAVALAREFPDATVMATDISAAALVIARRNAERYGVTSRIEFVHGTFLEPIRDAVDLIVSNPPYVRTIDAAGLSPEVRDFEPATALYAGPTGLDAIADVLAQAVGRLRPGGWMIVEFGFDQEAAVRRLIRSIPQFELVRVRPDFQDIPRVAVIKAVDSR